MEERPLVIRCKVAVVGDAAAGKTALVQMFVSKGTSFPKEYRLTQVNDLQTYTVALPTGVKVELFLMDSGGHAAFRDSAPLGWEGAGAALLVYDCTSRASYQHLAEWLQKLKSSGALRRLEDGSINAAVVATKADLAARLVVQASEAKEWAKSQGMEFFEASALPPGRGVEAPFAALAQRAAVAYESAVKNRFPSAV